MKDDRILLGHGSGGRMTQDLIRNLFLKHFSHPALLAQTDSAILPSAGSALSFTTDSFVVDPIFFPGGNIGKLAVCGTVNDLAVAGSRPMYLSASFIIEEGFSIRLLEEIVISMKKEAEASGVRIVTGDTKVVNRNQCDKIFITTSGLGLLEERYIPISTGEGIRPGDKVIINGSIGDHGMAIMSAREELKIQGDIISDCACLNHLIERALNATDKMKFMRDATRGGLATVLSEVVQGKVFGVRIDEASVKVNEPVRGFCELLGFDPLYVANEGKVVMIVGKEDAERVVAEMKKDSFGRDTAIIGEIVDKPAGKAYMTTMAGGSRIIDMLAGEQLPRIC